MMDIFDNATNKRIISGNFPAEKLDVCKKYVYSSIDIETNARPGLQVLKDNPILLYSFFSTFKKKVEEIAALKRAEVYEQDVNIIINTEYDLDSVNAYGSICSEAMKLNPAITKLDRILWYGAWAYYFDSEINLDKKHYEERRSMMFVWIYFLRIVEDKELKYGYTLDVDNISTKTCLLKLLVESWDRLPKKIFKKLTDLEMQKEKELADKRKILRDKVKKDIEGQFEVAKKTETEWQQFLKVVNDMSAKEQETISKIKSAGSARDKIKLIQGHDALIRQVERGRYNLGATELNLLELFECVNERFQGAALYCTACTKNTAQFKLHPAVFMIAMNPRTYNYLFMTFHKFRMNPNKETAKNFAELALSCLKRNLGMSDSGQHISIDEIIADFTLNVRKFTQKNWAAIERLSFNSIQNDSVVAEGMSANFTGSESFGKELASWLEEYEQSEGYDKEIEKMLLGNATSIRLADSMEQIKKREKCIEESDEENLARQIVVSLNIIYMFCDALRIMLTNKHANIKIKNSDQAESYRYELLKMDDRLIHKVYEKLDDREIGMLEYREKTGVIAVSLSEQESEEEAYRNDVFSDVLKDMISQLTVDIESQNIDQILETKTKIKNEIMGFPDCDEKEQYAIWLDDISDRLSNALIQLCKRQDDDYSEFKSEIVSSLGAKCTILPDSTVDSLTTAEMLYNRYASEKFAEDGFDFSCISALYYQAFEESYNKLIWRGYSDRLNSLIIGEQKYTDILDAYKGRGIDVPDARGYLDQKARQRGYYVDYANRNRQQTSVSSRCMYKSFAILMENIKNPSSLPKFCDYFAEITGFPNKESMFNDVVFMTACTAFTDGVNASADNRNNASHGGTFVSMEQCSNDKKTVLYDIETLRNQSIGLIQQLINLIKPSDN